jgi:hypothetical protein
VSRVAGRGIVPEREAVVGVDEHETAPDAGLAQDVGLEHRAPAFSLGEPLVVVGGVKRKPGEC